MPHHHHVDEYDNVHVDNHHSATGDDDIINTALHGLLDDVNKHLDRLNDQLYEFTNDVRARLNDLIADDLRRSDNDGEADHPGDGQPGA